MLSSGIIMINGCKESHEVERSQVNLGTSSAVSQPDPSIEASVSQPKPRPITPVTPVKPRPTGMENAPIIKFENPIVDLGRIGPNSKNTCIFKFTNVGKSTLIINKIEKTCGCQDARIKDNKMKYDPDESGEVIVIYSSGSYPSPVMKKLYLHTNDPVTPKAGMTIKAVVELKVSVEPKRMELFLSKENGGSVPLKLKSTDGKPFSIKDIVIDGGAVSFDYDPQAEGTEFSLMPKIDIAKLKQSLNATARIELTHPDCKLLTVTMFAKPCLSVQNQRIMILNSEPGQSTTRDVIITNNCDEVLEIKSISSRNKYMEVVEQQEKDGSIILKVKATVPPRTSNVRRYINDKMTVLFTNDDQVEINFNTWYKLN